ncbi:MAG: AAA family ATPase, partial [Candidatus Methanofastidiosa archaeon]|nr:AAA family ATPase [Candidatus Methanofastidiosa archaeon]
TGSNKKVYIIDEAHQLTKEAANALLKILEEAPPHAIFILATTEAHKMIPTIISRCQRFDFRKLTLAELVSRLKLISEKEGMNISKEALELIALNSEGAARDAEGLLGQIASFLPSDKMIEVGDIEGLLGLVDIKFASEMAEYILVRDPKKALELIDELINRGKDLREFAKILTDYLRKTMIVKILEDETDKRGTPIMSSVLAGLTDEDFKKMKEQATRFKEEDLKTVLDLMIEAQNKMKYSSIIQLPLELVIIEMTGINR